MILDAKRLTDWQACRRRGLLHEDWTPALWRPKALFDACLRRAIFRVSNGADPAQEATDAKTEFMTQAADPGLDVASGASSWVLARDWCAMLDTIVRAVSRLTLLTLKEEHPVRLAALVDWRPRAWRDESGQLHSWVTVDRWDDEALTREMHSWFVFGDIIACEAPLMIHAIEIGQIRSGRRASPWARAWRHPGMSSLPLRFVKTDGSSLSGWKSAYLADDRNLSPDAWVDTMTREGECARLIRYATIGVPAKSARNDALAQILFEAAEMRRAFEDRKSVPWSAWPMSRGACDGLVPCPFQLVCHREQLVDPASLGLYHARKVLVSESSYVEAT